MNKFLLKINLLSQFAYFGIIVMVWIIAFFFLIAFQIEESTINNLSRAHHLKSTVWSGVIAGLIWGSIFKMVRFVRSKISSYFLSVLLSAFVNMISAFLLVYCLFNLHGIFVFWDNFPHTIPQLFELYNSQLFDAILVYFFIVGFLIEVFYDIDRKLGKGMLLKFLLGQYYKPKEEERIFLFMDLKSSTFYAETLGHFRYSKLIQDCFKDISRAVVKNKAQIYQFVGDEVVLTWKLKQGIKNNRCLRFFMDFKKDLEARKTHYQKHYGMVPVFKIGMHSGKVMVAQVGILKSEIAYHGDTINTASRIQQLCNAYNSRFLLSGTLLQEVERRNQVNCNFLFLGKVLLTGKKIPVDLYSLSEEVDLEEFD